MDIFYPFLDDNGVFCYVVGWYMLMILSPYIGESVIGYVFVLEISIVYSSNAVLGFVSM